MGIVERKEREKEEMKLRILNAARKLFLEQGFEKTSIRNIAEAIEYSPGTIYLYYKDKNELLFALHQESFLGLIESFEPIIAIQEPFEQLVAMGQQYLKYAIENPELYDLMFMMTAPIDCLECRDDIWEDGHTALNMLNMILSRCQGAGYFVEQDLESLSLAVWATVHGLAALHLRKRTLMFAEAERIPRIEKAFETLTKMLKKL